MKRTKTIIAPLLAGSLLLLSCASTRAPKGWLPDESNIRSTSSGAWSKVSLGNDEWLNTFEGELLAVSADSLWICTDSLYAWDRSQILFLDVTWMNGHAEQVAQRHMLASLASFSAGLYAIFLVPLYWLTGAVSYDKRVHECSEHYTPDQLSFARKWSRFPTGLPANFQLPRARELNKHNPRKREINELDYYPFDDA